MTVRDLLELVSEKRAVKIKPNGRRVYYVGSATEVPEGLMGCEVTELAPGMDDEDNLILGVWVTADKDWDLIVDCFGKADDVVSSVFDSAYYQLIGDRETQEQEAQTIIQKNREERGNRWYSEKGLKAPKFADIQGFVQGQIEWEQETMSQTEIDEVVGDVASMLKGLELYQIPDTVLER